MEYLADAGSWTKIKATYPTSVTDNPAEVEFTQIDTTSVRAVLTASGSGGQGVGGLGAFRGITRTFCRKTDEKKFTYLQKSYPLRVVS